MYSYSLALNVLTSVSTDNKGELPRGWNWVDVIKVMPALIKKFMANMLLVGMNIQPGYYIQVEIFSQ